MEDLAVIYMLKTVNELQKQRKLESEGKAKQRYPL